VTAAVATQIADRLEVAMENLGDKTLKNISRPVRLYRIGFDGPVLPEIEAKRSVSKPSIVVLPFNNMSGDPEQEFLRPKSQIPSWQGACDTALAAG
jgi:adenylate cyclase